MGYILPTNVQNFSFDEILEIYLLYYVRRYLVSHAIPPSQRMSKRYRKKVDLLLSTLVRKRSLHGLLTAFLTGLKVLSVQKVLTRIYSKRQVLCLVRRRKATLDVEYVRVPRQNCLH